MIKSQTLVDGGYVKNLYRIHLELKSLLQSLIHEELNRMQERAYNHSLSLSFDIGRVKSIVIDINKAMDKDFG